ncbi:MAG: hypothetical protein K2L41_01610, partial [Muribaculaceae bacterium]|nr:hypothetical protein [Muribaculaceae bacterium]
RGGSEMGIRDIIMDEPDNALYYLMRGKILNDNLKEAGAARQQYQRALDLDLPDDAVKSFKGFVDLRLGNKANAISWIESILSNVKDTDGSINYYAACLYAQIGNKLKALDCMERSLENGYADYYNWTLNDDSVVSVTPIRTEKEFTDLLQRYNYLFNE